MGVLKNKKNGTWYFKTHYKDSEEVIKYVTRRGFTSKREASEVLFIFTSTIRYASKLAREV